MCAIILALHRGIAQLVEYRSPKPWVAGSNPPAPAKSLGRFRSDREKTRKAEISRDFSVFFDPIFFRISIDPFSSFLQHEGFELPKASLREEGDTRQGFPEANEMSFGGSLRSVTEGACATLKFD